MKKHPKLGPKKSFKKTIGIIGVGYVGLPLAVNFSKYFNVIAYDKNKSRISELKKKIDRNLDYNKGNLSNSSLKFSSTYDELKQCNIYIITLPTPLDIKGSPDLTLVIDATKKVSKIIKNNDIIIFESTFYPGTVDEILIPIIERNSNLNSKTDFFVGYSPERINPGDKYHRLEKIKKIIASNTKEGKIIIRNLYKKIIKAGIYEVSSIKTAELSKILENSQRYVNIALVNQISTLCDKLDIQTKEVIDAASTKWNFMSFYPGLVGGHCVAIDPIYLSYKQKKLGLSSKLIDISKDINEKKIVEIINKINLKKKNQKILILGATFKENCPDFRNSGSISLIKKLNKKKIIPYLHDPYLSSKNISQIKNCLFRHTKFLNRFKYDYIIITVSHNSYKRMGIKKIKNLSSKKNCKLFDLKSIFKKNETNFQL